MIQKDRYGKAKLDVYRAGLFIEYAESRVSTEFALHDAIIDVLVENDMLSVYNLLICRVPQITILLVARTHNLIPDIGNMTDTDALAIIAEIDKEHGNDVLAQLERIQITGNIEHAGDPEIIEKMAERQALPFQHIHRWMRNLLVTQDTHPPMDFPKGHSDANEDFSPFGGVDTGEHYGIFGSNSNIVDIGRRGRIRNDASEYDFFGDEIGHGSVTDDSDDLDGNRQGEE